MSLKWDRAPTNKQFHKSIINGQDVSPDSGVTIGYTAIN